MVLMRFGAAQRLLARCVLPALSRAYPAFPQLSSASLVHTQTPQLTSNRTSVVRCFRKTYVRMYPVMLVRPDGSTIYIKYKEPRRILMMPIDLSTLSVEERQARQRKKERARFSQKTTIDFEDNFRVDDYSRFWKKK
ncbi:large ribosomal subunit protein mL55 [Aulostomus maculatus]